MKLLASLASPYTRKVRVVLAEKKIECELELVDVNPVENPVNATNPLGKVPSPVLDDAMGVGCGVGGLDFRKAGDVDWHAQYAGPAQHYRKLMERAAFADTVPQSPK